MWRIRIDTRNCRRRVLPPGDLPIDPRDPDIVRAKAASPTTTAPPTARKRTRRLDDTQRAATNAAGLMEISGSSRGVT
jgi:hypothetical protein